MTGRVIVFGKLPAHGDFVARGLAAAERDALDDWLARSLADARETLGDDYEAAYDAAPPWRFAWVEPDGAWTAGAMAPSVDGVGRRYPILAARTGVAGDAVAGLAEAAEPLLYEALAGGWTADRLAEATGRLAPVATSGWTSGPGWWTLAGDGDDPFVAGARPPRLMHAVLTGREGDT